MGLGLVNCVTMVVFHGRYAAEMFRVKVHWTTTVFVTATNKILPWPLSIATINRYPTRCTKKIVPSRRRDTLP